MLPSSRTPTITLGQPWSPTFPPLDKLREKVQKFCTDVQTPTELSEAARVGARIWPEGMINSYLAIPSEIGVVKASLVPQRGRIFAWCRAARGS